MERTTNSRKEISKPTTGQALIPVLNSPIDAVVGFSLTLEITGWNTLAAQLTGLDPEQALGVPVAQVFPFLNQPSQTDKLTGLLLKGSPVRFPELELVNNAGACLRFSASCYPQFSAAGHITGGYAFLTESKTISDPGEQLSFADQVLSLVSQQGGQLVCRLTVNGRFISVNEGFASILGFQPVELQNRLATDFLHPDDVLAFQSGAIELVDSPHSKPALHRFRHKNGHYVWLRSVGKSLRHADTLQLEEIVVVSGRVEEEPAALTAEPDQEQPEILSAVSLQADLALSASSAGVWAWNTSTELVEMDEGMRQLLDLRAQEREEGIGAFLSLIHPEDQKHFLASMREAILSKSRFNVYFRVITAANRFKYLHAVGSLVYLPNSIPSKLLCLCFDVTEQKQAEEQLQQQEEELRNVYNNAPCGICWLEAVRDNKGLIVDFIIRKINQVGAAMSGRPVEELVGERYLKEFPGVKPEGIFDEYVRVVENRKPIVLEKNYGHENMNISLIIQASPLEDGLVLTFTDVSAQRAIQQQLEAKQYLQAKINETAPSLIAVLNLNTRRATYLSKGLHQFLSRKPAKKEPKGYDLLLSLLHPDDAARLPQVLQQVSSAADYDLLRFRFRFRDDQQTTHWHQVFVKVFKRDAEGHVEEVLCLVQDIDEAEQNKSLLKSTLDSSLSGIMAFEAIRDAEGKIEDFKWVLLNKPAEQLIGRKSRYVMGRRMLHEMPGNLSEGIFHKFVEVVETGQPVQFEHYYTYKGCLTWFQISAVKMDDGFTATFTDVSPRKEAEWELLESKLFNEKITTTSPFLIGVYNLKTGKPLYFNHHLGSLLGYSETDLLGFAEAQFSPIVHPDDQARMQAHFAALAIAADKEVVELESRIRCADGNWKWLHSRDTVFRRDTQGAPTEILTIVSDISELKQKSDLLESVVKASPVGICALKAVRNQHHEVVDFTWLLFNQAAAALVGYSETELQGQRLLDVSPVHMRNGLFADYAQVVETGQPLTRELEYEARGRKTWVRVTASPLGDGLVSLTEDISEQKENEARQNRHDQLLREAQKAAGFGTWELDLDAGQLIPSEQYGSLLGFEPNSMPTALPDFLNLVYPDDREQVTQLVESCRTNCAPFSVEHRMLAANGEIRHFILQGQKLPGQAHKLAGIALDVTQLREITQRLDNFRQLELVSEAIPHIVWTADNTGRTNYVNSRWEEYTGQPQSPLPVCAWYEVLHPDDQPLFLDRWLFCVAQAQVFEQEVRVKNQQGLYRWHLVRSVPYLDLAGNVLQWYGTGTDIQVQKEAMQALQQHQHTQAQFNAELNRKNEQLRKANADMDNFIYMASHDLKSPISNIQGLVQCLAEEFTDQAPGMEPILQHIQQAVHRFRATLAEMSEVIVAERAQEEPATRIGLAQVIEELKEDLAPLLEQTSGQIEYDLEVPQVSFARKNLRSLLFNLLSNALKYHSPDRPPLVQINTRPVSDGMVLLTVQDNGLGLTPKNLSQAFTLFKRVYTHTEGSGMGLYLVKRMVENGGGRIEAESTVGRESLFKIYLRAD